MKLHIENLGPVKKMDLDLSKNLTVFCGKNNSGKTYVCYLIYGFADDIKNSSFISYEESLLKFDINELIKNNKLEINLQPNLFEEDLFFYVNNKIQTNIKKYINSNLNTSQTKIELKEYKKNTEYKEYKLILHNMANEELFYLFSDSKREKLIVHELPATLTFEHEYYRELNFGINHFLATELLPTVPNVHMETAERNALSLFSYEISETQKQQHRLKNENDTLRNLINYPLPIERGLILAERAGLYVRRGPGPFAYLAEALEQEILGGQLSTDEYGLTRFKQKDQEHVDLQASASIVKSLSGLVFYLRYLAKVGDWFLMDEPELNLHPDNQRKVTRILAQMANAGIKVWISTHSDYVMRELNNLIMLYHKGEQNEEVQTLMQRYNYHPQQLLNPEQLGAYFFEGEQTEVQALEINETGFDVSDMNRAIHAMNNSSEDIFYTLYDS